jgi:hypothetical protein
MIEYKLQILCFEWFVENHPAHRKLLCYNLNNSSSKSEAIKNKRIGLQAGRSDMVLYFDTKAYHFEFKSFSGLQSDLQRDWEIAVRMQGFEYFLIRDFDFFKLLITIIIENAPRHGLTYREYVEQYLTE